MEKKHQEDWLDRQLREAAPYIDDDGFTSRVLRQLPARQWRRDSLRNIILLGITFLASALAYALSDGAHFVVVAMARLATLPTLWLFLLAFGSGIAVMAGGVLAAIFKTKELQS